MGSTLYLHIGHHKTASTALQYFLTKNYETFKAKGILYPQTARAGELVDYAHHSLAFSIQDAPQILEERSAKCTWESYLESLQRESADIPVTVISTEIFCENILPQKLLDLQNVFNDIKVIYYVRRADTLLQSIENFLTYIDQDITPEQFFLRDYAALEVFSSLFGKENIIVRPFEKQQFPGGSVFADLLAILGLKDTTEFQKPVGNVNESTKDLNVLEFYDLLKKYVPDCAKYIKITHKNICDLKLLTSDDYTEWRYPRRSPAQRIELIKQHGDFYANIARDYLKREDGVLFYDPLPDVNESWQTYPGLSMENIFKAFGCVHAQNDKQMKYMLEMIASLRSDMNSLSNVIKSKIDGSVNDR